MSKKQPAAHLGFLLHLTHYDPVWVRRKARERPWDLDVALAVVDALADEGFPHLAVDCADAVAYRSHPELRRRYTVPMSRLAKLADRALCIGYAYAEITVDKETDAVLLVGADDSEKIWLNREKVFELFTPRPLTVDQDKVPVKLKAGTNTILIKIWQNNLPWTFCVRVAKPDGFPVMLTQKTK